MELFNKKRLIQAMIVATTATLTACGGEDGDDGQDGQNAVVKTNSGVLTRIATVPYGAEVTGMVVTDDGSLFFNAQHPDSANGETDGNGRTYTTGTVGVIEGINFNRLPETLVDLEVPETAYEQETVQTAYGTYKILAQTGDTFSSLPEGIGNIYNLDGSELLYENENPDFNGYVAIDDDEGYLFTNWEQLPGGVSRMHLKKEAGEWSVLDAIMVDFADVNGTAANCFGSVSPWGTPLTSEEWVVYSAVDSTTQADWNQPPADLTDGVGPDDRVARMWELSDANANPYDYGYIVEITDPLSDAPVPVKHFTIGRYEHENSTVMPDGKTVYSSQDDTGGVLFKFVADTAEDLSSGTLYGAKMIQDTDVNDPAVTGFDVEWVALASGNNTEIESWVDDFDVIGTDDYVDGETSYMTTADVEAWAAWVQAGRPDNTTYPTVANGGGAVTAGQPMDDRSAFLESRYAAKQLGATAEWRKLEGISINQKRAQEAVEGVDTIEGEIVTDAYLYIGIADIDNTMVDGEGDMQLSTRVKDCGGVYRARLGENYNISRIEPVVMGSTYRSSLTGAERCDVDQLSQPDNVIVMNDGRILIGEDGFQENNTLWMYEPAQK